MSDLENILTDSNFGSRIAEDEIDELQSYFVETEQWRKLISGEADIVFGSKGSGKSALYALLVLQREDLRLGKRTVFIPAENPRGTPVFRDLVTEPPIAEEQFRGLWKLYFLSIAADYMRLHMRVSKTKNTNATLVINLLTENELLFPGFDLVPRLRNVLTYVKKLLPTAIEGTVKDPTTGYEFTGKISLNGPSSEQRKLGWYSLDELLSLLNGAFLEMNITVWLALDRLDVAFSDSIELEGNAIKSLFRSYLDMQSLSQIKLKIFLRDDIWSKVVSAGFREASHITRSINLNWDRLSLLNLVVRRLVSNSDICSFYNLKRADVLASSDLQENFFYMVFPSQIDIGSSKPFTFDWMLSRTADGTKRTAPRELIHLLLAIRDEQLRLIQIGSTEPIDGTLFDRTAIRSALQFVSRTRYEQTLCAEHPKFKDYLGKLERERTQQTKKSLAVLWNCSEKQALELAEKCVEIGFFERRGKKDNPSYWVPFLYRDALQMIQGSA